MLSALAGLLVAMPRAVQAGNDDEFLVGSRAAMTGGAVITTVDDSSATWYNPAGLAGADRQQVDFTGTAYTLRLHYAPKMLSTVSGASADGQITEFLAVPTQAAYVRKLSPRIAVGFGYFAPKAANFALKTNLDDKLGDPQSQWQLVIAESATDQYFAAGIGLEVGPRLRLGASLVGGYSTVSQSWAQFGAATRAGRAEAAYAESELASYLRISAQLGLGVQLDLTRWLSLGIAVRTPELQIYTATTVFYNESIATPANPDMPLEARSGKPTVTDTFELLRAGRAGLSLAYRYAAGYVSAEIDIQPPLRRPAVGVNRSAVWNARAGLYHHLSSLLSFGAGLFTDRSSDRDEDRFGAGRQNFYGGTLGLELSNTRALAASERVNTLVFTSVFAIRYAFSAGDLRGLVGDPDEIGTPSSFSTAHGRMYIHELSLYISGGLHF